MCHYLKMPTHLCKYIFRVLCITVHCLYIGSIVVVQSLGHVPLFETPWTGARQASLSFTLSRSLLKLMSIESVMPSNHLILRSPFLLLPSVFPSIRVFSKESALCIGWPKYWNFSSIETLWEQLFSHLLVYLAQIWYILEISVCRRKKGRKKKGRNEVQNYIRLVWGDALDDTIHKLT